MPRKKESPREPLSLSFLRMMHTDIARPASRTRSSPPPKISQEPAEELVEVKEIIFVPSGKDDGHGFWYTRSDFRSSTPDDQRWPGESLGHG